MQTLQPQAKAFDIRTFESGDTDAVVELWQICDLTRAWNDPHKDIQRKLNVNDELFLVAQHDNGLAGTVMGGYEGHRGWINYLAVHPNFRKHGLGRKLMNNVEERLLGLGCPKINLQIRHTNTDVIAFYEAIGFIDDEVKSYGKRLIRDDA